MTTTAVPEGQALLVISSHRARDRARRIYPDLGIGHYQADFRSGRDFYLVPQEVAADLLALPSVTAARMPACGINKRIRLS